MALVEAYDKNTGRKLLVPEKAVGHPVAGPNLSLTPQSKAAKRLSAKDDRPTEAPVAGDEKE